MPTYIPSTVNVTVSLEGRQVSQKGFTTPLFIAVHNLMATRQKLYTSAAELISDGFPSGSPAVKFATGLFSGRQAPSLLRVGRAAPSAYTIQVDPDVVLGDNVTVNMNVNGTITQLGYVVDGTEADLQAIGTAFAAVLAAEAGVTSATSNATGLVTVVPADAAAPFAFGIAENTTIYTETSESVDTIMGAVRAETDDFAILAAEMHDKVTQDALATYTEANEMIYRYSSQDPDCLISNNTDNIFYNLKAKEFEYTEGFFHTQADKEFGEGALVGTFAGQDPSYLFTANLQSLKGLATDSLSAGAKSTLATNAGNWYVQEQGVGVYHEGFTPSGDFGDRTRFGLWMKLRSQESLFATLKRAADRSSGVGYNDAGIAICEANLRTDVINVGIRNGAILTGQSIDSEGNTINYNPIIDTNTRASQTNAAISQRLWEGFEVEVVYNSAIHHLDTKMFIVNNRTAS